MTRAVLVVLDSFGIGGGPDAAAFGDAGSDTLGHIAAACAEGRADRPGLRAGPLRLPNLDRLGLGRAAELATGRRPAGLGGGEPAGRYAAASEVSNGKDTPSGHWEITGVPVPFDWGYFPETRPCFPPELVAAFVRETGVPGILGDRHASGTAIIAELGEEHVRTGRPILYTSADSVLQIAAHEEAYGLDRLLEHCRIARRLVDPLGIGRVIARPFVGRDAASFVRTANRRDFAVPPPEPTLLSRVEASGRRVIGVGKIGDIFAHVGVTEVRKGAGNDANLDLTLAALANAGHGDLVFTNLVDFDTEFGHRRDVAGYAACLEAFDRRLPELEARLGPRDLLVLTADHGCDPSWTGTDHTRERVPVLMTAAGLAPGSAGVRTTFADIGETVAAWLGLAPGRHGRSML
ncbi:phosphopentomutase [Oharaeibacter diazotrophicus]|uniref:Phosphopentomutase n=2 Tax=Oharaeibacter diazotrophicus TaxID=1920512 RepID=A0A4R6RDB7_9HYPH|nr:phosphopentomutase [Oharaeibacter diazotrophicus]TDP84149.1 phosphopentomutase [Oharaeibacter diazotrophicus]BBE73186.1 phosphopentomutase [Pleomorphomonas sp. SM30]GLS74976.1 phosphopentomutase [Oharaeibacter diazotrophicus]